MTDNRVRRLILAALVAIVAVLWLQPYSVASPFQAYISPAKGFLHAALAQDSLELQRRAVSPEPVRWALQAAKRNPQALAVWAKVLRPYSGDRRGDTATVVFQVNANVCDLRPIAMTFVQDTSGPRVLRASSPCFAEK